MCQEDLWRRSFEFLKEHLSPEMIEKYCPPQEQERSEVEAGGAAHQKEEDKGQGAIDGDVEMGSSYLQTFLHPFL